MSDLEDRARDLGMKKPIARRDFLQGVAIGIVGAYAALRTDQAAAPPPGIAEFDSDPADYPRCAPACASRFVRYL